jgi:hypothetical protein
MDRRVLKKLLEKAEIQMFEGAWRVARQEEFIAEMSGRGIDVGHYKALLATFRDTLRFQRQYVQRLKRELYCRADLPERPRAATRRPVVTSATFTLIETETMSKDGVNNQAPNALARKAGRRERRRMTGR